MPRLSAIDAGFLLTESHHSPKHIAVLQVFSLPKGKGSAWIRKTLDEMRRAEPGFPFNHRLRNMGQGLQPELELDEHFEMAYHVRHTVLPSPGSDEQLLDVAARLHANLLDRDRPLWEFHLIEGLSGRRFAFYTKIHHSICDGVTFGRWFRDSGTYAPDDPGGHPIWQRDEAPEGDREDVSYLKMMIDGVKFLGGGVKTVFDVSALGAKLIQRRFFERDASIALPLSAPRTPINVPTGAARKIAVTSYPFDQIRAVSKAHGATINDVIMTMCDLAISRYFDESGTSPDGPLVVYMPVNLRADSDEEKGNLISLLQIRLASSHRDPGKSLKQVKASISSARAVYSGASRAAVQYYSLVVALLSQFEEMLRLDTFLPPSINLVVSNVPGPTKRMYFRGAELKAIFPISTLPPMTALNVTACSYAGTFYFGLVSGRSVIPDLPLLSGYLDDAFRDLAEAGGVSLD